MYSTLHAQRHSTAQKQHTGEENAAARHPEACTNPVQQTTHPSPCFFACFPAKVEAAELPKRLLFPYFPSLPSPRLPWPWTGDPFSARSSPLEVLAFQSSISLTGRQPLPESRVGGISGFWTAESHARSRVTGEKNHPSPFVYACLPPRVKEIISSTSSKAKPRVLSLHLPLSVASRPRPITSRRDTRLTTMQAL
jgi:hypothetical protein